MEDCDFLQNEDLDFMLLNIPIQIHSCENLRLLAILRWIFSVEFYLGIYLGIFSLRKHAL